MSRLWYYNIVRKKNGGAFVNRIMLLAVSAIVGISVTVIPVTVAKHIFSSGSCGTPEYVEPMRQTALYAEALHLSTETPTEAEAVTPYSDDVGSFSLSVAADRLTAPHTGAKVFASAGNSANNTFIYFRQNSAEYNNVKYGNQTIGSYGCGPTNMAVIISSITGKLVSPVTLARKSEEWGCFVSGAGTAFAFFPKAAAAYGINCYQFNYSKQTVLNYLKQGKMIICTMGKGYFTNGSHFVTLRGITDDGNILIADTYSESNTYKEWTLDYLVSQLKHGMMWAFYK